MSNDDSSLLSAQAKRRAVIDTAIRFVLALTFAIAAGTCFKGVAAQIAAQDWTHPAPHDVARVVSIFSIGLYNVMIGLLYVVRLRPVSSLSGAMPCAAAILGSFLMAALFFLSPRDDLPFEAQVLAGVLVIAGNIFSVLILLRLGKSFSILPEGRRLVTSGPYRVVRHPLYLAEAVGALGVVISYLSPWALLLVAAQISLQLVRIRYEEKVLHETFPEYADYAKRTWRLIPWIY